MENSDHKMNHDRMNGGSYGRFAAMIFTSTVVMFGLMIVGLIWICVYYITMGVWPLPQAGGWNILIGFGFAMIGFLMTTRWR